MGYYVMRNLSERLTIRTGTTQLALNFHFVGRASANPPRYFQRGYAAPLPALCRPSPKGYPVSMSLVRCFLHARYSVSHESFIPFLFFSLFMLSSTMPMQHVTQSSQPITTKGMGRHFTSPRKARDKKKSWIIASLPGHASKRQKLLDKLGELLAAQPSDLKSSLNGDVEAASPTPRPEELLEALPIEPEETLFTFDDKDTCDAMEECVRPSCPTTRSISMCVDWKALIPTIIDPFLKYTVAALGSRLSSCISNCQEQKLTTILCLFFDRK